MATKKQLNYELFDEGWWEAKGSKIGVHNDNNPLLKKDARSHTYSAVSVETGKKLFTAKTRKLVADWIAKRTGKKVVFKKATW